MFKCDVTTLVPQVVVGISLKLSELGTGEEYFFFPVMMAEEQGGSGKRPKGILKHKSEDKHQ